MLTAMLDREPPLASSRPGLPVIADRGFASKEFEVDLTLRDTDLLLPSFKREKLCEGESLLKSVRQLIESVNDPSKASSAGIGAANGPLRALPSASPSAPLALTEPFPS
ncbi:hypothetical protein [Streptomyces sp. YU58]|uniref:hypothetical protein n=1 Tax=Streptomyces sp. SX92 TaxID=3158972 RepID=UPI0027B89951|nr:hypothetical protein [Streptomyces coralus]WLW58793.1 hypothetical protein QU709_22540 [Streptomyces coralus]